jgi:DNA replication protein DnaC
MVDDAGFMNFKPQLGSWVSEKYSCLIKKFHDLDGKPIDIENKKKFLQMLDECNIRDSSISNPATTLSDLDVDRDYASYQTLIPTYGFGRNNGNKFEITDIAKYFIKNNDIDFFIIHQMLKFQYPNGTFGIRKDRGVGFTIKPLIFFLKILGKLFQNEKSSSYLSKIEINLIRKHTDHDDTNVNEAYDEIIQNRQNNNINSELNSDCEQTITRFFPAFGATGLINYFKGVNKYEPVISINEQQYVKTKSILNILNYTQDLEYKKCDNVNEWFDYYGSLSIQIVEAIKLAEYKQILEFQKPQIIFYGPPGTGKTHIAKRLANLISNSPIDEKWSTTDYRKLVQFHPSYSYEDFVQGIKPVKIVSKEIDYQIKPGIFQKLCEMPPITSGKPLLDPVTGLPLERLTWKECAIFVILKEGGPLDFNTIHERTINGHNIGGYGPLYRTNSDNASDNQRWQLNFDQRTNGINSIFNHSDGDGKWSLNQTSPEYKKYTDMFSSISSLILDDSTRVLIIDEINRGNLPKIFGELIYALEYRGDPIDLQYKEFDENSEYGTLVVPKNLFIIGTMNTADRSIVLFDTALRRRFSFIPLFPDYDLMVHSFGIDVILDENKLKLELQNSNDIQKNQKIVSILALVKINTTLIEDPSIGREKQIGHVFLLGMKENPENFVKIWKHDIIPLLEEFYFESPEILNHIFGPEIFTKEEGIKKFTDEQLFRSLQNYLNS